MSHKYKISETGLYTEENFKLVAEFELNRRNRYPNSIGLLYLSLNFDEPNPENTKNIYQVFAGVLNTSLRVSDIPGHFGDDFLVLLPATDELGSKVSAQRVMARLGGTQNFGDKNIVRFRAHIGVSSHPSGDEVSLEELIKEAGLALRNAQGAGPHGFKIYS